MDVISGLAGAVLGALAAWQTKPKLDNISTKSVVGMMLLCAIIGFLIGAYIL